MHNPASPAAIFAHARAYPYDPPPFGYRFRHDVHEPQRAEVRHIAACGQRRGEVPTVDVAVTLDGETEPRSYTRRVPVIAAGSNASFTRLKSKFAGGAPGDFPVLQTRVRGLVAVYSAHISRYGAIPGTLNGEEGALSTLHVAFLNAAELKRLNKSESLGGNYALVLLSGLEADFGEGCALDAALAYVSLRGAYAPDATPVRLAAFKAEGSRHKAVRQNDMLERARRHLEYEGPLERFVHEHVVDADIRARRMAVMGRAATPCRLARMRCVAGGLDAPSVSLPEDFR